MRKLFAILAATMLVCGLCVAPAFAIENEAYKDELPVVGAFTSVELTPQTDNHFGDLTSTIAIICALGFGAIVLSISNRFDKEE